MIVTDLTESRITIAKELGFETIRAAKMNPVTEILKLTSGIGTDLVFECVGHPSTIRQLTGIGRERAQLIIVGMFKEIAPIDLFQIQRKEQK